MTEQDRERWTKLVADFETSDLTQREFASERGISFSNLRNWIYKLRRESRPLAEEAPGVPRQEPAAIAAEKPSRLLPVRVVAPRRRRVGTGRPRRSWSWSCRPARSCGSRSAPTRPTSVRCSRQGDDQ